MPPLSWANVECAPIMSRVDFEERVFGNMEINQTDAGYDHNANLSYWQSRTDVAPVISPKSPELLRILTMYLHDVGDILWFDIDGLRDTVILTPDLFCSKIIGAIFRPNTTGFPIEAVHGNGTLMPKSDIEKVFMNALGIDKNHVDAALKILCELGLCHRHLQQHEETQNLIESFLFPGALAFTAYRRPEWFGPLSHLNF